MNATIKRLITTLLLALMTGGSTYAGCYPDASPGPEIQEELLVDTGFQYNCPDWQWGGSVSRVLLGTNNWVAELYGGGNFRQTVTIPRTYQSMMIDFYLSIVKNNPGTERLVVEILHYGYIVSESVVVISPNSTQTHFSLPIDNYPVDDTITVRFRWKPGTAPGDTKFRVDVVTLWGSLI